MITVTEQAVAKAKSIMQNGEKKGAEGLRVQVLPGGCSGFSYNLIFDKKRQGDKIIEKDGFKVFVDEDSHMFIDGSKLDYVETLNESGFKIENPNAKSTCGCGSSFS